MRSLMLVAPLLLMSGCNLFRSGLIDKTCEDLPLGCGGIIDTQPTDDTGDSDPWVPENPYTTGMALAVASDGEIQLRVIDAQGQQIQGASLDSSEVSAAGPVAYDPIQPRVMLWDNGGQTLFVVADGAQPVRVTVDTSEAAELGWVNDAVVVDSVLYLVSATAIWSFLPGDSAIHKLGSAVGLTQIQGVFPAYDDNLFLLNWGSDDAPDLYRYTISTAENRLSYEAFDDSLGRVAAGFQGPAAKPHVCSGVGGLYLVEDLQGGDHAPAAFPSQADLQALVGADLLAEVTDCGWDDGAERYLVHSAVHGVVAVDTWGRVDALVLPEPGEQFVRASFFVVPEPDAR